MLACGQVKDSTLACIKFGRKLPINENTKKTAATKQADVASDDNSARASHRLLERHKAICWDWYDLTTRWLLGRHDAPSQCETKQNRRKY